MQLLAVVVEEGIDVEVAEQGVKLGRGGRGWPLLTKQKKRRLQPGGMLFPLAQSGQAKVAHGVLVAIQDMLREHVNELRRRGAGFSHDLHPGFLASLCVFVLVDNFLFRHMEDATLRDGQAADIAPGVSQEVPFRHLPGDVNVPPALRLSGMVRTMPTKGTSGSVIHCSRCQSRVPRLPQLGQHFDLQVW